MQKQQIPEVEKTETYTPLNDIDSVITIILRLHFKENWDFIFRQFLILIQTSRFNDMETIAVIFAAIKEKHRNFVI